MVEDLRIFEDDINGTEAHDIMLHEQGIIPLGSLKLILSALEGIREEWTRGEVQIGIEFEDVHEYIEKKVIDKIGIESGGMIHTGRSRNDQVVVDMRMRVRSEILDVSECIIELVNALLKRAEQNTDTIMMLYTHGQHAQIGTFGHYLVAYVDSLMRDFQRLMECYARVNKNPLGAGPVGGTSINIDRQRTTELLGFDGLVENSIDATSGRDWAIEVASACSTLMSSLSRMSDDILEWSAIEYGYLELADEYSSSSSIMPQKKNPSTLELIRGKTGEVYGTLIELLTMVKGVPSGYCQDLQGTKPPLWRCIDSVKTCLEVLTGIVSTVKVNADRMAKNTEGSMTVAVDLAESLVMNAGLSFRESYRLVANLVRYSMENGKKLSELDPSAVSEASLKVLGKRVEVTERFIRDSTDPKTCLQNRKSRGSPKPSEIERMIKERKKQLSEYKALLSSKRDAVMESEKRLREMVKDYFNK